MTLTLFAETRDGDLDNFLTGICDGLMAIHPGGRTWINEDEWARLPASCHPRNAILLADDSAVTEIIARREPPGPNGKGYELALEWDE